ncbi:MAG: hypothetical protein K1X94_31680 [Sandaracinaceae bacterium]|nr:hypothetical protein [Sandaracinaceae bacterium]
MLQLPRLFAPIVTTALAAIVLLVPTHLLAQDRGGASSSSSTSGPAPSTSLQWESGPVPELWAAPAIGLGVGGLTLAAAVVLGQVASADYHEAIDPTTTQVRASELARLVPDLSLAANVLFAVGGGMATLGAIWLAVLPFSQHQVAPSVRASFGPGGLTISGTF